jgi:hypothetical protein
MSDCERWITLSDRAAVGDALAEGDAAFVAEHARSCAECGREARFYEALPAAIALPSRRRLVRQMVAIAVAAAVAAGVIFFVLHREPPKTAALTPSSSSASEPAPRASAVRGDLHSGDRALTASEPLAEGSVVTTATAGCLGVDPSIDLCVAKGTVALTHLSNDRVVTLESGTAVAKLAKQPAGSSFSIATRAGTVRAIGTMFSVRVSPDGTRLVLHEGHVRVTHQGKEDDVIAPATFDLVTGERGAVSPSDDTADDALLRGELVAATAVESPTPIPSASAARAPSADELLRQARKLRAAGRYDEAAGLYERIVKENPSSPAARSALVSLGDLDLGPRGDAAAALAAFDRYLEMGGSLETEAQLGRIRALRKLGRAGEERAAIEKFLLAHPDHIEAPALRQRLEKAHP